MRALILLAAVAVGAHAGMPNGREAKDGELPQIVKLTIGSNICSGTIIGPNTVVTAAHCFEGPKSPVITITVPGEGDYAAESYGAHPKRNFSEILPPGVPDLAAWNNLSADQREQVVAQSKEAVRKIYEERLRYDLAVVKLASPAEFKSYIPVRVHQPQSDFVGRSVTLVGYGITDARYLADWGTERTGENTIRAYWAGLFFYLGLTRTRDDRAQPDGKDAGLAHGDSGGAMLVDGALVGVTTDVLESPYEVEILGDILRDNGDSRPDEGPKRWSYAVSLSDPENVAFLKSAEALGCKIIWAQDPAAPPAQTKRPRNSKILEALPQDGFSGDPR